MRMLIVAATLLAATISSAMPAAAATSAAASVTVDEAATLAPGSYVWRDSGDAAVSIVVSLPDQRAYVYRGSALVAVSTVSTGRQGRETPIGSFPVLQKAAMHRSTLYDDAAMPFMQRLTWDGVAIHAGSNPGFPTSHGCVHVPTAFAKKLFAVTRIGTQVSIVDASVDGSPVDLAPPAPIETQAETASANATQLAALSKADGAGSR
ncbi:L,D-transpeptidase family protein [Sphingomonas bacterium]|uniref:L,D-transpeptidase family protein n=1 Tax=Sphingomonas bacterium TaxID=1895847 RepID=UPI0015772F16|nr:L,D-transpeptidase family protein [Sphingomonas bacterium]